MDLKVDCAKKGFTDTFKIDFENELLDLQRLIYNSTKDFIVDHDSNLKFEEKIKLPFKFIPEENKWSKIMADINDSKELDYIIGSKGIEEKFKLIFKQPKRFVISTFRARFPNQKRAIYNWHQDEGTWFFSKNSNTNYKNPATLWLSVNGAKSKESIQLIEGSHMNKLYNHEWVDGQGFFKIKNIKKDVLNKNIFNPNFEASEAVIFHPLTMHRSAPNESSNLRPRYSIDIRYYDNINNSKKLKVDVLFKIKKFLRLRT